MDSIKLKKEKMKDFIAALGQYKLYAPQKTGETLRFSLLGEGDVPELEFSNTTVPPKDVVFPQTETLYSYELGSTDMAEPEGTEEGVVLGIRPCDARAMSIVDSLFSSDVEDPYYLERRSRSTLLGLACLEPCVNCFCTSLEGGPASTEGLDAIMTDMGESYLITPLTEKGEKLLQTAADALEKATDEDMNSVDKLHEEAADKIARKLDTQGIPEKLPELWEAGLWKKVSNSCLGCGICTYLCPTCHCFDIQDEVEGFEGRRCRMWDSCMFGEYSLHASGHNPRPSRRERTRNRINHKYSYYVDKFGSIACVGCGRCIKYCPVNIDIFDILTQVKEAL